MRRGRQAVLAAAAVLLVGVGGCVVGSYQRLAAAAAAVETSWAVVRNHLLRLGDLSGSLIEALDDADARDRSGFADVQEARVRLAAADTPAAGIAAGRAMDEALGRLLAAVASDPRPTRDEVSLRLMGEIERAEARLAAARARYDSAARALNTQVAGFPARLFAPAMGFAAAPAHEAAEARGTRPGRSGAPGGR